MTKDIKRELGALRDRIEEEDATTPLVLTGNLKEDFERLSKEVTLNNQKLIQNVFSIQQMTGFSQEDNDLRQTMLQILHESTLLAEESNDILGNMKELLLACFDPVLREACAMKQEVQRYELTDVLRNFQVLQHGIAQQERQRLLGIQQDDKYSLKYKNSKGVKGVQFQIKKKHENEVYMKLLQWQETDLFQLEIDVARVSDILKWSQMPEVAIPSAPSISHLPVEGWAPTPVITMPNYCVPLPEPSPENSGAMPKKKSKPRRKKNKLSICCLAFVLKSIILLVWVFAFWQPSKQTSSVFVPKMNFTFNPRLKYDPNRNIHPRFNFTKFYSDFNLTGIRLHVEKGKKT